MSAGQNVRDLGNDPGLDLATPGLQEVAGSPGLNVPFSYKAKFTGRSHKLSMTEFVSGKIS